MGLVIEVLQVNPLHSRVWAGYISELTHQKHHRCLLMAKSHPGRQEFYRLAIAVLAYVTSSRKYHLK